MAIGDFVAGGILTTDALASATSLAANACGLADRNGRLRPRYADIVVVEGDPLADITVLRRVVAVIAKGEPVE